MTSKLDRLSVGLAVALLAAGSCVQERVEPGPFSGPSELGVSLTLSASPDRLPLDGAARSDIGIQARDHRGEAIADLALSLQIVANGEFQDFGRLSTRQVVTRADGRASAIYTAPVQATVAGSSSDSGQTVEIWVTPVGQDFGNAVSRSLTIRLVPPGNVVPSFGATAGFAFTPATPTAFDSVLFATTCPDATSGECVRDPDGIVTNYSWSLGDGTLGSGPSVGHVYNAPGTYLVTLTIRDGLGRSADVTRAVVVMPSTPPTAVIALSPTDPGIGDTVFFNASGSTAAPPRTIASYAWDYGDGSSGSGATRTHAYGSAGTYTVLLTVTDDRGQAGTATETVTVGP